MCLHIDTLPDDCLLPIFDRIPVADLLQLDQVCHRWAFLQASACARRRTLVLIGGVKGRVEAQDFNILFNENKFEVPFDLHIKKLENCLIFPSMWSINAFLDCGGPETNFILKMSRLQRARPSGQLVAYLTNLFSNVTTLVVIHTKCNEYELHTLVNLLGHWNSLNILKLWIRTSYIDSSGLYLDTPDHLPVGNILRSIAQQASLQQLTLDIDDNENKEYTFPIESYSFIVQLKVVKLFLGRYDRENLIWEIVQGFDHQELGHISLGNMKITNVEMLLSLKSIEFTTKVRQLYSYMSFEGVEQLSELCWPFVSLTLLQIRWTPNITFTQLVSNLAILNQLSHLKLIIQISQHPKNAFALVDQEGKDEKQISLPQIKILELKIESRSHHDFESLSPQVFPSIEMVILRCTPSDCSICQIVKKAHENILTGSYNLEVGAEQCHRLLILSLKRKFANSLVQFYATRGYEFVDWSNYEQTEHESDDQSVQVKA